MSVTRSQSNMVGAHVSDAQLGPRSAMQVPSESVPRCQFVCQLTIIRAVLCLLVTDTCRFQVVRYCLHRFMSVRLYLSFLLFAAKLQAIVDIVLILGLG